MSNEFLATVTWLGGEVDPRAAETLQRAVGEMCRSAPSSFDYQEAARLAARSAVALALAGERELLEAFLTPDPQVHHVTWTVACSATGEVVPSHLRDFSDVIGAVCAVVLCDDHTHENAELIASSRAGVRWTAFERRGRTLELRLPSPQTIDGAQNVDAAVGAARRRWRSRLAAWAVIAESDAPLSPQSKRGLRGRWSAWTSDHSRHGVEAPPPPSHRESTRQIAALAARVVALEATVEQLSMQVRDMRGVQRGADVFAQLIDTSDDVFWSSELIAPSAETECE